jgi:RsiW-degrading membrane proteinase PrsW (M82 family)
VGVRDDGPSVPRKSGLGAGLLGCLASALLGGFAIAFWLFLNQARSIHSHASAIVFVSDLALIGLVWFRVWRRKDASSAEIGLVIGLALIGLVSGLCTIAGGS